MARREASDEEGGGVSDGEEAADMAAASELAVCTSGELLLPLNWTSTAGDE